MEQYGSDVLVRLSQSREGVVYRTLVLVDTLVSMVGSLWLSRICGLDVVRDHPVCTFLWNLSNVTSHTKVLINTLVQ